MLNVKSLSKLMSGYMQQEFQELHSLSISQHCELRINAPPRISINMLLSYLSKLLLCCFHFNFARSCNTALWIKDLFYLFSFWLRS